MFIIALISVLKSSTFQNLYRKAVAFKKTVERFNLASSVRNPKVDNCQTFFFNSYQSYAAPASRVSFRTRPLMMPAQHTAQIIWHFMVPTLRKASGLAGRLLLSHWVQTTIGISLRGVRRQNELIKVMIKFIAPRLKPRVWMVREVCDAVFF